MLNHPPLVMVLITCWKMTLSLVSTTTPPGKNEAIVSEENCSDAAGIQQQNSIWTLESYRREGDVRGPDSCWIKVKHADLTRSLSSSQGRRSSGN